MCTDRCELYNGPKGKTIRKRIESFLAYVLIWTRWCVCTTKRCMQGSQCLQSVVMHARSLLIYCVVRNSWNEIQGHITKTNRMRETTKRRRRSSNRILKIQERWECVRRESANRHLLCREWLCVLNIRDLHNRLTYTHLVARLIARLQIV